MTTPTCRFCDAPLTLTLVDLGEQPLSNAYLSMDQLDKPEPKYPLHARVCQTCRLVQVDAVQTPDHIFSDYAYFSSISDSWVEHARRFCEMARERWHLGPASKVVELASNDGYLLKHFVGMGVPVLGVEPAANVAEEARKIGVPTEVMFFGVESARRLLAEGHAADLMVGNNVLAHVPDINDFVGGFTVLLKPDGVASIEFPHLLNLIRLAQFDTIYHEHFSYLSLLAVERIFTAHGLRVFDVEEIPTHGGSLRVMACRTASTAHPDGPGLAKVRADEAAAGLDTDAAYAGFEMKVKAVRAGLQAFMRKAWNEGALVVGYGAAAKGNTLLNYCGFNAEMMMFVADRSPHKQGLFLPGTHIPIRAPEAITEIKPNYVLILPWNIKAEVMEQMAGIRDWGGRFVIAVPNLQVVR